jgi:hypothetical protein
MIKRALSAVFLAGLLAGPVLSDELPIYGKYGNAEGCAYDPANSAGDDGRIIVTPRDIQFHESGCDFLQVLTASYSRAVVTALCGGEGEEWVSTYLVKPGDDEDNDLHFVMQGHDFEFTVSRCQ